MAEEKKISTGYIGNALRSSAADHTTTFADEVFDTERQRYQSEVNTDIEERIEAEAQANTLAISNEATARGKADKELNDAIVTEKERAEAAEKANADNIAKNTQAITEEIARVNKDIEETKNNITDVSPIGKESGNPCKISTIDDEIINVQSVLNPHQTGTGVPTRTNPRPIVGFNKLNMALLYGHNLFNHNDTPLSIHPNLVKAVTDTGISLQDVGTGTYHTARYVICNVASVFGQTIHFSCRINPQNNNNSAIRIGYWNGTTFTSIATSSIVSTAQNVDIICGAPYVHIGEQIVIEFYPRWDAGSPNDATIFENVIVSIGSIPYESYKGLSEYSKTLSSIIYGGKLNWNTGLLVDEYELITLSNSYSAIYSNTFYREGLVCISVEQSGMKQNSPLDVYCSHIKTAISPKDIYWDECICLNDSGTRIYISMVDDSWTTEYLESLSSYDRLMLVVSKLANVQVCYKKENPSSSNIGSTDIVATKTDDANIYGNATIIDVECVNTSRKMIADLSEREGLPCLFEKKENTYKIYIPSPYCKKYTRYDFRRMVNRQINYDGWRIMDVYICDLELTPINHLGSLECEGAIKEENAEDFVGGYHGDEKYMSFGINVDGKNYISTRDFALQEFNELKFYVTSHIYHCNTNTVAFVRNKIDTFNKDGIRVDNHLETKSGFNVERMPLSMLDAFYGDTNFTHYSSNNDFGLNSLTPSESTFNTPRDENFTKGEIFGKVYYSCQMVDYKATAYGNKGWFQWFVNPQSLKIYEDCIEDKVLNTDDIVLCSSLQKIFATE